jgi:outer membrane biosynthesis protein TonB
LLLRAGPPPVIQGGIVGAPTRVWSGALAQATKADFYPSHSSPPGTIGLKRSRIYWIAGPLLTAGVLMLIASLASGSSPVRSTPAEGHGDYHNPKDTPSPKASKSPEASPSTTREPKATKTVQPSPTDTKEPKPTKTAEPSPTNTREPAPTNTMKPTATHTTVPPVQIQEDTTPQPTVSPTAAPPTETPTPFHEELTIQGIPNAGDGGLLAQHEQGVAVLGVLLIGFAVALIAARGAVDARQT